MKYPFYQVDVFTGSPLGGNPLAVFPDAEGLDNETMQMIAREMNLSETTFIFPHGNLPVDFSIRIFTPEKELPFAGHPTLGTAHILREAGKVPSGNYPVKLAMEAGVITVTQGEKEKLLFIHGMLNIMQSSRMLGSGNDHGILKKMKMKLWNKQFKESRNRLESQPEF